MFHWAPPSHCTGIMSWSPAFGGQVPEGAVLGGKDLDGGSIFVGRAMYEGDVLPAKVCPNHECAFVSYGGREIPMTEYEVLISQHVAWKDAQGSNIPAEAIKVGVTRDGQPLFVGRTLLNGTLTVGKVHPAHEVLYVSWSGEEKAFREYEILVLC